MTIRKHQPWYQPSSSIKRPPSYKISPSSASISISIPSYQLVCGWTTLWKHALSTNLYNWEKNCQSNHQPVNHCQPSIHHETIISCTIKPSYHHITIMYHHIYYHFLQVKPIQLLGRDLRHSIGRRGRPSGRPRGPRWATSRGVRLDGGFSHGEKFGTSNHHDLVVKVFNHHN